MIEIRSDLQKNRLYLTLSGYFEEPVHDRTAQAVLSEAAKLKPGFDLVSDISALRPTNASGLDTLRKVQTHLRSKGLRRVVRVTGIVLSEIQVDRTGRDAGYVAILAPSVEEAERILDRHSR